MRAWWVSGTAWAYTCLMAALSLWAAALVARASGRAWSQLLHNLFASRRIRPLTSHLAAPLDGHLDLLFRAGSSQQKALGWFADIARPTPFTTTPLGVGRSRRGRPVAAAHATNDFVAPRYLTKEE